jgi:hypothetical protein
MAYITQYDIDMKEQARDDANRRQFSEGLQGFVSGFESNRRQALDEKRQAFNDDIALSKMGATPDEIKTFKETGEADSIFSKHAAQSEAAKLKALRDAELDTQLKQSQINKNNNYRPASSSKPDAIGIYKEKLALKEEYEKKKGAAPIPDFEVAEGQKLAPKDREILMSQNTAVKNISMVGDRLKQNLNKYGITSGTGATQGDRIISQDLTDLQLQMKELFNLGVLNGPDLDLLNKNLGALQGPIDMMNPLNTRESAMQQVQGVIDSAVSKLNNTAQARGARYTGGQQAQPQEAEAKMQRLQQLRAKKAGVAMGGQ